MESSGAGDIRGGAKAREISALGISETSLARVTPRPFRRKFKFHRIEAAPACERTGIRKRSFVCAPNEQTDGARDNVVWVDCTYVRTYVRMNDTSLDAAENQTRMHRSGDLRSERREEVCAPPHDAVIKNE